MRIVSAGQMRSIDSNAINHFGIPGSILMENAALAVVREIKIILLKDEKKSLRGLRAVILAGKGNNGGDGLAVARHLCVLGMEVTVFFSQILLSFKGMPS